uniref:Uncharacterized protein n=1 Tax=Arundo donax TaxID=35708 RepID=A0A0A9CHX7_ARUDO
MGAPQQHALLPCLGGSNFRFLMIRVGGQILQHMFLHFFLSMYKICVGIEIYSFGSIFAFLNDLCALELSVVRHHKELS